MQDAAESNEHHLKRAHHELRLLHTATSAVSRMVFGWHQENRLLYVYLEYVDVMLDELVSHAGRLVKLEPFKSVSVFRQPLNRSFVHHK